MSLLAKSRKEGQIQHITPQSAGWRYIGFDVWMLKKGQTVTLESGDRELCLVLVAGLASVKTQHADFPNLGKRMSPFERTPPWSVYVPPQDKVEVTADSDLELAVCSAPGKETQLEETYYHRFDPPQGFAFQRVYTDDRSLDACMAPYNHDVVMVPRGYHPVAAIAGYDSYYLNVMAGPDRKWLFTWEDDHAWINTPEYPRHD
ncbi:TPA: 5-deoxy-glucuronate isomerase [Klebsiella pneumoniae]|nr:5-deoxy-glucuronate isomerase [Klebsiella pneumoniae]